MSTTGRTDGTRPTASDVATRLRDAGFVRLAAAPDGDAVAATGLLTRALDGTTPFQAGVGAADRATDADLDVAVGHDHPGADVTVGSGPASATGVAADAVRELGSDPDEATALAGALVAGVADSTVEVDLDRRPGVAVATRDLADGLAHSTLLHAPFSGDVDAAADALAALGDIDGDDESRRRVASMAALATVGVEDAPDRASHAVERALRPHVGGPLATVGGYADALDCLATAAPGTALALAAGHDVDDALDAWRDHAQRAHETVRSASTRRYDGLYVVEGGPVETVARLALAFRSPEPVVLAVADGRAVGVAADDRDLGNVARSAASAVDASAGTSGLRARIAFDGDPSDLVAAFREAL